MITVGGCPPEYWPLSVVQSLQATKIAEYCKMQTFRNFMDKWLVRPKKILPSFLISHLPSFELKEGNPLTFIPTGDAATPSSKNY